MGTGEGEGDTFGGVGLGISIVKFYLCGHRNGIWTRVGCPKIVV